MLHGNGPCWIPSRWHGHRETVAGSLAKKSISGPVPWPWCINSGPIWGTTDRWYIFVTSCGDSRWGETDFPKVRIGYCCTVLTLTVLTQTYSERWSACGKLSKLETIEGNCLRETIEQTPVLLKVGDNQFHLCLLMCTVCIHGWYHVHSITWSVP